MEYIHIYLLVIAAVFSFFGIFIFRVLEKEELLDNGKLNLVEAYVLKKKEYLEHSMSTMSLHDYFILKFISPIVLSVAGFFLSTERSLMLILLGLGFFVPDVMISLKGSKESQKFSGRYVRAIAQMASALHSQLTVEQAIDSVVNCELLHRSIKDDFKKLSAQIKLGKSIEDAFYEFAKRTGNPDVYDTAIAISIMMEIGGDAGVAIEKIQKNIEDRMLYRKKRDSMMTESRLIMLAGDFVPIACVAAVYIFIPDIASFYTSSSLGMLLFLAIAAMFVIGSVISHKMMDDKVDIS